MAEHATGRIWALTLIISLMKLAQLVGISLLCFCAWYTFRDDFAVKPSAVEYRKASCELPETISAGNTTERVRKHACWFVTNTNTQFQVNRTLNSNTQLSMFFSFYWKNNRPIFSTYFTYYFLLYTTHTVTHQCKRLSLHNFLMKWQATVLCCLRKKSASIQ